MKTVVKKITLLSFIILASCVVSCKKDDDSSDIQEVTFSAENTAYAAKADNIVEGSQNLVEGGYVQIEEPGRMPNSLFPECTAFTITTNGNGGTILIDFGLGCTLYNGVQVSGKIGMEYGPLVSGTRSINYSYIDFVYNGNAISGGGNINRTLENNNGNPQSTVSEDITINFSGSTVTANRNGLRITEWIQGVGSGTWEDNVYSITGTWQTELSNGFERTGEVIEPLIRELSCIYFVEGRIEVIQEGLTGILDFGNGTCDAVASIIFNGIEYPVILGN